VKKHLLDGPWDNRLMGDRSGVLVPDTALSLRQYYVMVGLGAFVTTIAQPGVIGRLPIQLFLKREMLLSAHTLAGFMLIAGFAWNLKPLAGILSDAFPILGTRRRHYMLLGSGLAALCWLLIGIVPRTYWPLLLATFGANALMVVASTVMGGLMVEAGQRYGVSGRVTSIRQALQSAVSIGNGVLGGYLAAMALGWTVGIAAGLLLALALTTFFVLTESPVQTRRHEVLSQAGQQLATLARSYTLLAAGVFLALVYITPGFATPLLYLQTDSLKFTTPYIGLLETIEGATGLGGALVYAVVCRRFNLRQLLTASIALNAVATLLYLGYSARSAPIVHGLGGLVTIGSELALMDLAVRATPSGCESLGFSLMMSARNFALKGSDVIGSWLLDNRGWTFPQLVWLNAGTTALVLIFIPLLPRLLMSRREGEAPAPRRAAAPPAADTAVGART
jgi:MFS family permease